MRGCVLRTIIGLGLLAAIVAAQPGYAQKAAKKAPVDGVPFLETTVKPLNGTYLVMKPANVRARPLTKGKRIGRLDAGDQVRVIGRAKGPWLAVQGDDGQDLGFVYELTLMPVVDGALDEDVSGELRNAGRVCQYKIHFDSKSPAQGQPFEFADYEVRWQCAAGVDKGTFTTPMFLTEGPYQGTRKPTHQITVDILELNAGVEEVFSTHVLWDRETNRVTFDSVSVKRFGRAPATASMPATDVPSALQATLMIVHGAWNTGVWRELMSRGANSSTE